MNVGAVETERLRGRRPSEDDAGAYVGFWTDPLVPEDVWPADLRTADDARRVLQRSIEHWDRWGFGPWTVLERTTGAVIGRVGLAHTVVEGQPEVEVAWFIASDAWGRGYATEMAQAAMDVAFGPLELTSVVSYTTIPNVRSQAIMRKLGLEFEREIEHAGLPHVLFRRSR